MPLYFIPKNELYNYNLVIINPKYPGSLGAKTYANILIEKVVNCDENIIVIYDSIDRYGNLAEKYFKLLFIQTKIEFSLSISETKKVKNDFYEKYKFKSNKVYFNKYAIKDSNFQSKISDEILNELVEHNFYIKIYQVIKLDDAGIFYHKAFIQCMKDYLKNKFIPTDDIKIKKTFKKILLELKNFHELNSNDLRNGKLKDESE